MKSFKVFLGWVAMSALLCCGKTQPCIDYNKVDPLAICTTDYNPVCGCDDITYQNQCYAQRNGVVAWIGGPCP